MAGDPNIQWTPWLLMAGLSSVVVGQGHLLLHLRSVGGGVRSFRRAVKLSGISLAIVAGIDLVGGLALGCAFAFFGATQPSQLVDLVRQNPAVGWIFVGIFGPIVSDRSFAGSFIRGKFDPLLPNRDRTVTDDASSAWRLRNEAVATIADALWHVVRDESFVRYCRLKSQLKEGMASGAVRASNAAYLFRDFYAHSSSKPDDYVSAHLGALLEQEDDYIDLREDSVELVLSIGVRMLNNGHWDPIAVLVGAVSAE